MATSGTSTFNETRDQIVKRAMRLMGVIKSGETIAAQELTDAAESLNAMVKRWSATPGMHVWCWTEATLFPAVNQISYQLSTTSTDHCASSYVSTTLSAAASSGATSLSVASITGISNGDNVGVLLSTGALYWTTINGAPSGTTINLTAGLSGAAASGTNVFTYTSNIVRPLKVSDRPGGVRRYNLSSTLETPIGPPLAREDYQMLPNKAQAGVINQVFYDPQLTNGVMYLWQPLSTITDLVKFSFARPIQDFDNPGDNPDLPQEWLDALAFNLADNLAPEYDVPGDRWDRITMRAQAMLDAVAGFDREAESILMQADMGPGY